MVIQKEEANGQLYQLSLFTTGFLPGQSPRQRARRRQQTDAAKRAINARAQRWRLMQLLNANFEPGRDLFVCLTYRELPANEGRALEGFHRRVRRALEKHGVEHGYIAVTSTHELPEAETDVRLHHHLVMHGAAGAGAWEAMRDCIAACWPHGAVDVRPLRDGDDFYESTARYLLDQPTAKGARKYSTSRNLRPPNEPVRLRLPESAAGEAPPGVKVVEDTRHTNEYGHYRYLVGRIYDRRAFDAYWKRQRKRAAPDPWERLRRRRYRLE